MAMNNGVSGVRDQGNESQPSLGIRDAEALRSPGYRGRFLVGSEGSHKVQDRDLVGTVEAVLGRAPNAQSLTDFLCNSHEGAK